MYKGMLAALGLMAGAAQAETPDVYLVATVQLGGSNLAKTVFLHEPQITTLEGCRAAVRAGQRDRDWQYYHHIFQRDRFQGFTGELDYRCTFSEQSFSVWNDRLRYSHPYLVTVDVRSRLQIKRMPSQARCTTVLAGMKAVERKRSFCTLSSQTPR